MNGKDGRVDPEKAEGRFLLRCLEDEPHQNGFVIATPGGKRLVCCSAAVEDGLEKWEALGEAERRPGAVRVEELPEGFDPEHLEPPPGAIVLETYVRGIERDPDGGLRRERSPGDRDLEDTVEREEPGRDHVWILEPEWRSLLPPRPVKGDTWLVPAAVAERIARFHVIPTTAQVGGITPPWRPDEVRESELSLTVEDATSERVRLRIDGAALLARGAADLSGSRFGFAARLLGYIEADLRKDAIDRFDLVALGETRGARSWRTLSGVAFELARPGSPGGGRSIAPYYAVDHNPYGSRERYLGTGLREWLENMVLHHGYSAEEVAPATGLDTAAARRSLAEHGLGAREGAAKPPHRARDGKLLVLPYPGGRHPRIGFLDGAIDPRRDTKASIFLPWEGAGYAVVDVPEALWSNLGLTFLAHTHIPTVWDQRGIRLPACEWRRARDGVLANTFLLPNGIRIDSRITPREDAADLELRVRNGSAEKLTGLRTQVCIMLKGARGFTAQTNDNKVMAGRAIAARSEDGRRWIVTAWERAKPWANPPVPCIHSDPTFPDLGPGEEAVLHGRIFFFEGDDILAEVARREREGTLDGARSRGEGAPAVEPR